MPLDPLGYIQLTIQLTLTDTFLVLLYIEYGYIFGFIVYQVWIHFWFYCISNMDTFLVLLYIEYGYIFGFVYQVSIYIPCFIFYCMSIHVSLYSLVSNMFYALYWCPACFIILMSAVQSLLTYNVFSRKLVRL